MRAKIPRQIAASGRLAIRGRWEGRAAAGRGESAELSVWRNTLDHFDAIKVGARRPHQSVFHRRGLSLRVRAEYERAVREGYLVDFDVVTIKSDVRMAGVFLQEGEEVGLIDPETGRL